MPSVLKSCNDLRTLLFKG